MKTLIALFIFTQSLYSFAGNGSGTLGAVQVIQVREKIRFVSLDRGELTFKLRRELGSLIEESQYRLRSEEFKPAEAKVLEAIHISASSGTWIDLQSKE